MSLTITGDRELKALLAGLGERVQRKVLRDAVSAGATPILKSAKQRAAKRSGLLRKSLGKKVVVNKKTQTVTAIIGPRKEVQGEYDGKLQRPSRYAHLVEKGFIDAKGVFHPPQPFLDPAVRENQGQAISAMSDKLAAGVIREASK